MSRRYRIQQALLCAKETTSPVAFAVRELRARGDVATYALRSSGLKVCVHHGTEDLGVLDEVFRLGWYDWPPDVSRALAAAGDPLRVADLGAHVGMFGVHVLTRFPGARITAFEPDPVNREALTCAISANGSQAQWTVVDACAAASDGTVLFEGGQSSGSKQVVDGGSSASRVPAVDALPVLADADLIKMDIEGGEWEIVGDPRFRSLRPAAMVLEYHDHLCPHPEPRAAIEELLGEMSYRVIPIFDHPGEAGMLWALRAG